MHTLFVLNLKLTVHIFHTCICRNDNKLEGDIPFGALSSLESLGKLRTDHIILNYRLLPWPDIYLTDVPFCFLVALLRIHTIDTLNIAGNNLSGDATELCSTYSSNNQDLVSFETDCKSAVTCTCCTRCM